jgi:hypothetical protein
MTGAKGGGRDVFGYMEQLRGRLLGNWKVLYVDGHVEKRKKDRKTWTFEEIGNDKSDLIAGRCMRAAAQAGRDDAAALVKLNAQVDATAWHLSRQSEQAYAQFAHAADTGELASDAGWGRRYGMYTRTSTWQISLRRCLYSLVEMEWGHTRRSLIRASYAMFGCVGAMLNPE